MTKLGTRYALECLALKTFAHVFSAEAGKKFFVQMMEYDALAQKLLDKSPDRAETLEIMHSRRYWDVFLEELSQIAKRTRRL